MPGMVLLGVEFDVFYKYTYDILQNITSIYPASLGGHVPTRMNDGTFDNKGFELILNTAIKLVILTIA